MAKSPEPRAVRLPLAPLTPETVEPFGRFEKGEESESAKVDASSSATSSATGPVRHVRRREGAEVELALRRGERVILGPASDPMRCRALPGEREFRAYEAITDGVLRLAPGVWFTEVGERPAGTGDAGDEERDLGELFNYHLELPQRLEPGPFPFPGKVGLGHLRNPKDS